MKTTRRKFLQWSGAAIGSGLLLNPTSISASSAGKDINDNFGILIDSTRCVGCQNCERACCEKNGLPAPSEKPTAGSRRSTGPAALTVVNGNPTENGDVFCKSQCMHCDQPACVSACLTNAMYKTPEGPVIWREEKCMGCRYCMVACPFDVPKFEYGSINPRVQKCTMCYDRISVGKLPACVEACPQEALAFGKRGALLAIAKARIAAHPSKYDKHIFGETEAGGTNVLYLASVPFGNLGFNTRVGTVAYPEYTKTFLYSVPLVLLLAPAFLAGLRQATKREGESEGH